MARLAHLTPTTLGWRTKPALGPSGSDERRRLHVDGDTAAQLSMADLVPVSVSASTALFEEDAADNSVGSSSPCYLNDYITLNIPNSVFAVVEAGKCLCVKNRVASGVED